MLWGASPVDIPVLWSDLLYMKLEPHFLVPKVLSDSFVTPWTLACQASLSMGFHRQEYWNGLPFPSPGGSSRPRDQTCISWHWEGDFLWLSHQGSPPRGVRLVLMQCICGSMGSGDRLGNKVSLVLLRNQFSVSRPGLALRFDDSGFQQDAFHGPLSREHPRNAWSCLRSSITEEKISNK